MVRYKQAATAISNGDLSLRLQMLKSPEITRTIEKLYARYGKYAVPVTELRKKLDKEMGKTTMTDELYAMREGQ